MRSHGRAVPPQHSHSHVYVRPIAYKSSARIGVARDRNDAYAIVVVPFGDYFESAKGLKAGVVSLRRIEDTAIPGRAKICGAYVNSETPGRRSDLAHRIRTRRRGRRLQPIHGAQRQADHPAGHRQHP